MAGAYRVLIFFLLLSPVFFLFSSTQVFAQDKQRIESPPKEEFFKAEILQIIENREKVIMGRKTPYQKVRVRLLDGDEKGKEIIIAHGERITLRDEQKVSVGEKVVLLRLTRPNAVQYEIVDKYRLDKLISIGLSFVIFVLLLSRWRGAGAIAGLLISLGVIVVFIVPQILAGRDPLLVSILGSIFIMVVTLYLAHGFSKKTSVALVATFISLMITGVFAVLYANFVSLTGMAGEGAYALRFGPTENINFKGLLLGGMIIGALGVLDDITTSLSAAVFELAKANPKVKFEKLIYSGLRIGMEHVSSLVNTLVLAYAGVGLPLFILIAINPTKQPLWTMFNSEFFVEEVIRSLVGSLGLILAVPITVLLAAWVAKKTILSPGARLRR